MVGQRTCLHVMLTGHVCSHVYRSCLYVIFTYFLHIRYQEYTMYQQCYSVDIFLKNLLYVLHLLFYVSIVHTLVILGKVMPFILLNPE